MAEDLLREGSEVENLRGESMSGVGCPTGAEKNMAADPSRQELARRIRELVFAGSKGRHWRALIQDAINGVTQAAVGLSEP